MFEASKQVLFWQTLRELFLKTLQDPPLLHASEKTLPPLFWQRGKKLKSVGDDICATWQRKEYAFTTL